MILSSTATHALRALALLAHERGDRAVLGRELARRMKVPPHYLSKVLATLARAGILQASRGVKGGYRLARPPAEIHLIEAVEPFEGKRTRPGCLLHPELPCTDGSACSAHGAWSDVKAAYARFLETTTVADIREKA